MENFTTTRPATYPLAAEVGPAPADFTSGETAHDRAHRAIRELLNIALGANAYTRANKLLAALELLDQLD